MGKGPCGTAIGPYGPDGPYGPYGPDGPYGGYIEPPYGKNGGGVG